MKIQSSKTTSSRIIWYWNDESVIYLLHYINNLVKISIFNPESLENHRFFLSHYHPNLFCKPIVDQNCIYLPSNDGRIIGMDKFSGQLMVDMDLGMMNCVSNPKQSENFIYTICNIPITNGFKTLTKSYVICKNDKQTGKKICQSKIFDGVFTPLTTCDNYLYVVFDKTIYKLSQNLDVIQSASLVSSINNEIVVIEDKIILSNKDGYAFVFDKNLILQNKFIANKNKMAPIGNFWFSENKIFQIQKDLIKEIKKTDITPHAGINFHHAYCNDGSNMFKFNSEDCSLVKLFISENGLRYPIIYNDSIYICDHTKIFKVEICK